VRALAATGLVAALAFAVGAAAAPAPNVRGVLVRGPVVAGCRGDDPCDPPAVGTFLVFERGGRVAARALVGASGVFALRLPPATYALRLAPPPLAGQLRPGTVRVPRVGVVRLRLAVERDTS
jgi:hypothetical protein